MTSPWTHDRHVSRGPAPAPVDQFLPRRRPPHEHMAMATGNVLVAQAEHHLDAIDGHARLTLAGGGVRPARRRNTPLTWLRCW